MDSSKPSQYKKTQANSLPVKSLTTFLAKPIKESLVASQIRKSMELRRIDAFLTFKNRRNLELQALGAFRAFNNLPIDIKVTIIYPSLPSLLDRLFLIMILLKSLFLSLLMNIHSYRNLELRDPPIKQVLVLSNNFFFFLVKVLSNN